MQSQHDMAPHLDQIKRALGDKVGKEVSEDDLRDEFAKYLEYGVPPDQAVKTVLRHHGVTPSAPTGGTMQAAPITDERVALADVPPNVPSVNLLVRIVTKNPKIVNARGEEKEIQWGMIGDETATVPFTSWRPMEGLEVGDVIAVQGAYSKEYQNEVQINFGDRSRIEKRDASELPTTAQEFRQINIGDLRPGLRGIKVTGRVLQAAPKDIHVKGEPKTIWTGILGDETGKVEWTAWSDPNLKEGAVVTIEGGYIRAYRGIPQFNFDKDATITPFEGSFASPEALEEAARITIGELVTRGGGNDVIVEGTLLEVRPGSGLVFRDPETRRVVTGSQRGPDSTPDLRIKGVLDDGTGAVNFVVGREITEALLGKDLEACAKEAQEAFRSEIIQDQLQALLTAKTFRLTGNALRDEYGMMLIAREMKPRVVDLEQEARKLLETMGAPTGTSQTTAPPSSSPVADAGEEEDRATYFEKEEEE